MTNVDLDDDEEEGSRFEIGRIPVLTSARQHLNIKTSADQSARLRVCLICDKGLRICRPTCSCSRSLEHWEGRIVEGHHAHQCAY